MVVKPNDSSFPPSLPPTLPYLRAERRHVRADEPVRVAGNRLGVHVLVELHVAGVDAEDLQTAVLVRHPNVNLAVEAAEPTQGRVAAMGKGRLRDLAKFKIILASLRLTEAKR